MSSVDWDFTRLQDKKYLLEWIECKDEQFEKILNKEYFQSVSVPKKNRKNYGKYRQVSKITDNGVSRKYKSFATKLTAFISAKNHISINAHGYKKGKNTKSNAAVHCGAKFLMKLDVKDFFSSITSKIIEDKFKQLGIDENIAILLTQFITIDGKLPLGLPTSPIISNLVFFYLDNELNKLAQEYNCNYTRYADDISISGHNQRFFDERFDVKNLIRSILYQAGFSLAEDKYQFTKLGQAHYVTGLSVSDTNAPHIPKMMKRKLRQEIYYCKKYGIYDHLVKKYKRHVNDHTIQKNINRIDGLTRYASYINPKLKKYQNLWERILKNDDRKPKYDYYEIINKTKDLFFYIDESELEADNGSKFLLLCCVAIFNENERKYIHSRTEELHSSIMQQPKPKPDVTKNGIHFNDMNEDERKQYIDHLKKLTCEVHVIFCKKGENYSNIYIKLFKKMVEFLSSKKYFRNENISFFIEKNNKVQEKEIQNVFIRNDNQIQFKSICSYNLNFVDKKEHLVALPDFFLGIFMKYVKEVLTNKGTRYTEFFDMLSGKYCYIMDMDNNEKFNRHNHIDSDVIKRIFTQS